MKVLGICSYKGTNYYGWQKQVGFVSVQSKIEECLSKVYDTQINIQGSGRTDAGVHALKQYFHYVCDKEKDLKQLTYALNKMLPDDIKILSLTQVDDDFHSRYNATKKIYEYRILLTNKDPLSYDLAYIYPMELDVELFKNALQKFEGTHNFQDFTSKEEDEQKFSRNIGDISIKTEKNDIEISLTGDGFMRYMVRMIVGNLIQVGLGKLTAKDIEEALENPVRKPSSFKAPAYGLYLKEVKY